MQLHLLWSCAYSIRVIPAVKEGRGIPAPAELKYPRKRKSEHLQDTSARWFRVLKGHANAHKTSGQDDCIQGQVA